MAPLLLLAALPQPLGGSGGSVGPAGRPGPQCPALYVSEPARPGPKVRALLPDGSGAAGGAKRSGPGAPPEHDALLPDPSPGASFGHPPRIFRLDFGVSPRRCRGPDRVYLACARPTGSYECLTLALRSRCENRTERQGRGGQGRGGRRGQACPPGGVAGGALRDSRPAPGGPGAGPQAPAEAALRRAAGAQPVPPAARAPSCSCPQLLVPPAARAPSRSLPVVSPSPTAAPCELDENTRRCHRQQLPSHESCRMYQTCHHAVLISGGWQEQITCPHHARNLRLFAQMLGRIGFRQEHIEAFFAGDSQAPGIDQLLQRAPAFSLPHSALDWEERGAEVGDVYPAAEKRLSRSHLALGCRGLLYADSLVLYLNSPGGRDGTMLLWASKENGSERPRGGAERTGPPRISRWSADPRERYPVAELLADLEGCNARSVFLFLDRSYPGPLARKLLASGRHGNVVLVSGQLGSDVARGSAPSEFWARPQPAQCLLQDLGQVGGPAAAGSSPGATLQLLNVTLAGAPCHSTPPRTEDKRRREFLGCQNLPTRLWCQATHTPQQDDA
ncbi:unnamed protein product [Eretmochelys imbricata]